MNVRAKFKCEEIKHNFEPKPDDVSANITFRAVYGDGKENKDWSKYTPWGELKMGITNPAAIAAFEQGKEYYLDFTPA